MKTRMPSILALVAVCFLLAGCAASNDPLPWASITGKTLAEDMAGEDFFFQIPIDQAALDEQMPIKLYTSGAVQSGRLTVELRDPQGQPVWNPSFEGPFNADGEVIPEQTGTYTLGITWAASTSATLNLAWNSIALTPRVLVSGVGMLAVAIAFSIYVFRRGAGWRMFLLGASAWIITVAVKILLAAVLNQPVTTALYDPQNLWSLRSILYYLYVGLMTGVTEVLLTWLFLRNTRFGQAALPQALGFSIGFGAFEAALLGAASLASAITALANPGLVASAMGSLAQLDNPLYSLGPVAERLAVVLAHLLCNLLLFYGARRAQSRWFWAAFWFKSLLDALAGFAQLWGVESVAKLWTIEAILLVFGFIAWLGWRWLEPRFAEPPAREHPLPAP